MNPKMASNSCQTKITSFLIKIHSKESDRDNQPIEPNDIAFDHELLRIKKEPLSDVPITENNIKVKKEII